MSTNAVAAPVIWQVHGTDNTVYLVGSLHELRPQDHPLPAWVDDLPAVEEFVFETNFDDLKSPAQLLLGLQKGTYTQPDSLSAHVTAATYARIVDYAAANNIRLYQYYKPWLLEQGFVAAELKKAEFSADFGADRFLFDQAKEHQVSYFETTAFQIDTLAALPEQAVIAALEWFLDDPSGTVDEITELTEAWRTGDLERMLAIFEARWRREPEITETVVTARTLKWLPQIEDMIAGTNDIAVVVDVEHLLGTNGLIQLLSNKGYSVARLSNNVPSFLSARSQEGAFTFTVRLRLDESYTVESSHDLKTWMTSVSFTATNTVQDVSQPAPSAGAPALFFRLRTNE